MVVIQHQQTEEEEQQIANPLKAATAKSSTADAGKDISNGFETASDAELGSDGDDDDGDGRDRSRGGEQPRQQQQEQDQAVRNSSNDASNCEELAQKALAQANEAKLDGNNFFGDGKYEEALSEYELALQVASEMPSSVEIRSICHANRAVCFLKLGKYENTIKECTKALELNPVYVKALVRRGEAHEKLEHFDEAIADMKKILKLIPQMIKLRKPFADWSPLLQKSGKR